MSSLLPQMHEASNPAPNAMATHPDFLRLRIIFFTAPFCLLCCRLLTVYALMRKPVTMAAQKNMFFTLRLVSMAKQEQIFFICREKSRYCAEYLFYHNCSKKDLFLLKKIMDSYCFL